MIISRRMKSCDVYLSHVMENSAWNMMERQPNVNLYFFLNVTLMVKMIKMVSKERQFIFTKREDGKLAVIYKTDKMLRTFVVTQEFFHNMFVTVMNKKIIGDPCFGTSPLEVVGFHVVEATMLTMKKMLGMMSPFEIKADIEAKVEYNI